MTDKLEADRLKGQHAQRLLDDEVLKGAFETLRTEYLKAWEASQARDSDGRERLWQAVQIVGKVQSHLVSVVNSGTLAKAEIDAMNGVRPKRFGIV